MGSDEVTGFPVHLMNFKQVDISGHFVQSITWEPILQENMKQSESSTIELKAVHVEAPKPKIYDALTLVAGLGKGLKSHFIRTYWQ